MPNTPVPAAGTGLPSATIIPFPARPPAEDDFEPMHIPPESLVQTADERSYMKAAAFILSLEQHDLARRLANPDPEAQESFREMLAAWADLNDRLEAFWYIVRAAEQRVAPILEARCG